MITLKWSEVSKVALTKQSIVAPWLVVLENLDAATKYLRFKASGEWIAMGGLSACGPDGLAGQSFPDDHLVVADCAVGALIGRIGGSSATLKGAAAASVSGETNSFPIGCHTVIKLPDNTIGPVYVGFNILSRPVKLEVLELEILGGS